MYEARTKSRLEQEMEAWAIQEDINKFTLIYAQERAERHGRAHVESDDLVAVLNYYFPWFLSMAKQSAGAGAACVAARAIDRAMAR